MAYTHRMPRAWCVVVVAGYEEVQSIIERRDGRLRNAVLMMSRRVAVRCFEAWRDACVGQADLRERRTLHIIGRIRNRAVVLCLEAWRDDTRRARELKAYYAARWANLLGAKVRPSLRKAPWATY